MPQKEINHLHLNVENTAIDQVRDFNFLGLTIKEHLNWKGHLDKLSKTFKKPWMSLTNLNILFL